ncbi:MAG: hypothetical protein WB440_07290 [Steroidobacteraceae bacterium]|jgi:predicted PurR-regulated permease PerM
MNAKVASLTREARVRRHESITTGKVLVWGGIGILLYVAHAAFIPITLALLFALMLSGPVEALRTKRVPRSVRPH